MITNLKLLANQRDVPYQSLVKIFLADRLKEEIAPRRRRQPFWRQPDQAVERGARLEV